MKVNLFTFAILLQLSLCIIATSSVNSTTDAATATEAIAATTAATTAVDVTTGLTQSSSDSGSTKKSETTVTTALPVKVTHETLKKVNKKLKKDAKKNSRARKMKSVSTEKPQDVDFDDESAEDEELVQPRVSHRARGHKSHTHAAMKSRRHHWPRSDASASYRSRVNRHHRNKPLASWRSDDDQSLGGKAAGADGGDCASTIECIMKNIDPKEFCCKDDKSPPTSTQSENLKNLPPPDAKSEKPSPAPAGPSGESPSQPGQPSQSGQPPQPFPISQGSPAPPASPSPPPPPPPQNCECTCSEDGSKLTISRGQFDSLKSSAAYRTALMHEAYNSYHWNPYTSYGQMPYGMPRAPFAYGR